MAGVTVIYKGDRITTFDNSGIKTLETAEKYCEDDIIINYNKNGDATKEGNSTITVTDAEEDYVCGLTQYGVCEQNASTNAISCNNGVLSISGGEIITTATNSEILTLGTQTATVENLYSVGNVRDTQEIVSGKIIHKNDICIYDGTQSVGDKYISSTGSKENGAIIIYPLETEYTGTNLASFTETNQGELNSLEVGITPIQDLHGYSSPWPAGGGVSKCPSFANGTHTMTNGLTVTIQDGEITIDGTASSAGYYEEDIESTVMPADAYISFNNPVGTYNIAYAFINGNTQIAAPSSYPANGTKQPTGLSGATVNKVRVFCNPATYDNFKMSPIVHDGSTPQAWQPYANICPITGRTGLNVYRTGKNLAPLGLTPTSKTGVTVSDISNGYKLTATSASIFLFARFDLYDASLFSGKKLTISGTSTADHTQNPQMRLRHLDADGVLVSDAIVNGSGSGTLSIPQNAEGTIALYLYNTASATSGSGWETTWTDIMLELGESASTYVPHASSTYAVDWASEAGTVYGGTLDVVTGVLTVDRAIVDLGTLTWTYSSGGQGVFYSNGIASTAKKPPSNSVKANILCSDYACYSADGAYQGNVGVALNVSPQVWYHDGVHTDSDLVGNKAQWLDGVQLCYELATPLVYQLTAQEIKTFIGTNNVWSNDITSIKVAVSNFTIEQVTPQPLKLQEGNNTVNATNLSVSAVPLKLEYMVDLVERDSTDLTVSGATVTAPAGYYAEAASKSAATGAKYIYTDIDGSGAWNVSGYAYCSVDYAPVNDGKARFWVKITDLSNSTISLPTLNLNRSTTTIVWGDGNTESGNDIPDPVSHTYTSVGIYCIEISFSGTFSFSDGCGFGQSSSAPNSTIVGAEYRASNNIGASFFFDYCDNLKRVTFCNINQFRSYSCSRSQSLQHVKIIGNVEFLYGYGCLSTPSLKTFTISNTTPPNLPDTFFRYSSTDFIIYVPYSADHSVLTAYQSATNWSVYADRMMEGEA